MKAEKLIKLSKDLSFKIFDPVSTGDSDGKLFSAELRLGYINRAFGTLIRTLETIHPKLSKVFKNYYQIVPIDFAEGYYELPHNYDVFDIYYHDTDSEWETTPQQRASYIEPVNYKSTEAGLNDFREATEISRYWTIIDNKIRILPDPSTIEYFNVQMVARNYFPEFTYSNDADTIPDIDIPTDYMDILITMAAIEAMSDKGETTKYQLYTNALSGKLQLLAESKKYESIKEEGVS